MLPSMGHTCIQPEAPGTDRVLGQDALWAALETATVGCVHLCHLSTGANQEPALQKVSEKKEYAASQTSGSQTGSGLWCLPTRIPKIYNSLDTISYSQLAVPLGIRPDPQGHWAWFQSAQLGGDVHPLEARQGIQHSDITIVVTGTPMLVCTGPSLKREHVCTGWAMCLAIKRTCPQVEHIILFSWETSHPVGHDSEIGCIRSYEQWMVISWNHWLVHEWVVSDEGEHTVRQRERWAKLLEFHVIGDALEEIQDGRQSFPGARKCPRCLVGLLL